MNLNLLRIFLLGLALLGLACCSKKAKSMEAAEFRQVQAAREYIKQNSLFPSTVEIRSWKHFENDDRFITTVDFSSIDANGSSLKERWTFSFDKTHGTLLNVVKGQ